MKFLSDTNNRQKVKSMAMQIIKGILAAVAFTIIAVLIFAVILKSSPGAESAIPAFNIIIKILSIVLGSFFALKTRDKGWLRGLITGIGYMILGFLVFSLIDGNFSISWGFLLDLAMGAVVGAIMGIILVNMKKK